MARGSQYYRGRRRGMRPLMICVLVLAALDAVRGAPQGSRPPVAVAVETAGAHLAERIQAAVEKIVELEGLEASREEVSEAVALVARQNNMTVEELKPYYDAEFEKAVIKSVLTSKVMGLIRDAATVAEG